MASFSLGDVTKSVDELCAQLSMSNINVPKFETNKDVYEFINEFEATTATLTDNQRNGVLIKAFPPGRLRAWYDSDLKSLVETKSTWEAVKARIIERYADSEDRDRHFRRLHELKYDSGSNQKLFDYADELLYSLSKALPESDEETKIRYIKSNLPSAIFPTLLLNQDFIEAKDMKVFLKSLRQFDMLRKQCSSNSEKKEDLITRSEFTTLLKEIASDIKKENDSTRKVMAGLRSPRELTPIRQSRREQYASNERSQRERSSSPYQRQIRRESPYKIEPPVDYHKYYQQPDNRYYGLAQFHQPRNVYSTASPRRDSGTQRFPSPNLRQQAHQPAQHTRGPIKDYNQYEVRESAPRQQYSRSNGNKAFSENHYYGKFGVPPEPCSNCNHMHWIRHCPDHLN